MFPDWINKDEYSTYSMADSLVFRPDDERRPVYFIV